MITKELVLGRLGSIQQDLIGAKAISDALEINDATASTKLEKLCETGKLRRYKGPSRGKSPYTWVYHRGQVINYIENHGLSELLPQYSQVRGVVSNPSTATSKDSDGLLEQLLRVQLEIRADLKKIIKEYDL